MNTSVEYRENADNCDELAGSAQNGPSRRRLERLAKGWRAVAESQDWLDGAMPPVGIWEEKQSNPKVDHKTSGAKTDMS